MAWLHDHIHNLYKAEVEAYETLKDLQRKQIPQLLACVTIPASNPPQKQDESISRYLDSAGILLQYIEGFPLTDIERHAPREIWQHACDESIQLLNLISDHGILNKDVKTRSFIMCLDDAEMKFYLFMLDFALCTLRREFEDEDEWREMASNRGWRRGCGKTDGKLLERGRTAKAEKLAQHFRRQE